MKPKSSNGANVELTQESHVDKELGRLSSDTEDVEAKSGPVASLVTYWRYMLDQPLITPAVLGWDYQGSGSEADPYVVTWIDSDPRNPMDLSSMMKAVITAIVAILTLAVALISSTYAGCIDQIMQDFHVGDEVATLGIALYVLGFAVGPMLWAPFSETQGRQVILCFTYGCFVAFNGGTIASQNIQTMIILRFFSGVFSASTLTNTGGVISDIYPVNKRGLAMGLFAVAPFIGPVFGPIIGGFLGAAGGWRWVQALVTIFSAILWVIAVLVIPETYAPVLLRKRAAKLSEMTGKSYRSRYDISRGKSYSFKEELKTALVRPWQLMLYEPIVIFLSLYMSIVYGILYMFFAAIPIVYQEHRGWNSGQSGLAFLGIAVGMIIALIVCIPENGRFARRAAERGGENPPEERLIIAMYGSFCIPGGLFWFAWTNFPSVHFMASIAAGVPFGFGLVLIFISIKNYLVDSYTVFAASALAATVIMRSCFAAAFPLFTTYMFHGIGIHWASSIPAFLSLLCAPLPFLFYKWGPRIRARCRYSAEAEELKKQMMAHK
ncbi:hypothetical protein MPDQ_007786 [Monascus purpureus]|uniref:Major facilitator superfamily (MFS) profile domain-containing protein n=1 Tax=Monascus purpureus TaxID=5098 RepID=A0A507QVL2_MONPU|nr:hypothetical protein MPDQ_007786 [Monascus purpureus]BDD57581.1 hypothetical protein MAP00_002934 [Monascus purpureus]